MKKVVLIVDDDQTDVMAIQRSLRHLVEEDEIEVEVYHDGEEILEKFREMKIPEGQDDFPIPYIMFLDLNMPRVDGFEVLDAVRDDPKLKTMVVFVLSTSNNPKDISKAYQKSIAGYLVKSEQGNRYEKLRDLVQSYSNAVIPQS